MHLTKADRLTPPVYFLSDPGGVSGHCVQTNRWSPQGFNVFSVQSIYQHCPSGYGAPGLALAYPNANTVMCVNYSAPMQCPSAAAGETVFTLDAGGLTCSRCPAHAHGTPCACDDGYEFDAAGTSCILEQYTISLAGGTTIEPSKTAQVIATVKDAQGNGKSGVTVSIAVDVKAGTGGHEHDAGRHVSPYTGTLSAASGTTVADGTVSFTFGAPEISGVHTFTAQCDSPTCTNNPQTARINVKVPGLLPIPASPFYAFVGAVAGMHTRNHYLIPPAELALHHIALSYQWLDFCFRIDGVAPRPLHLNDASLVWGGKFDIKGKWTGDHKGHKRGVVIDVRANNDTGSTGAIPLASFDEFKKMAAKNGAVAQVHCTSNKSDGQNRKPPACIGKDGSQDNNRHFHILLLGVDQ